MTFAERLSELRKKAGKMSEATLAESSGVPFTAIREYAMGRRKPTFETVVKLAAALNVDCTAFADCEFPHVKRSAAKRKTKRPPVD
jgi:transcriptional regulator with XRE-family HTH domain